MGIKAIDERKKETSKRQEYAADLVDRRASDAMKIAAEAAERARLTQNKLFQEEKPCTYRKVF